MNRTSIALLVLTCLTAPYSAQASAIQEAQAIADGGQSAMSLTYEGKKASSAGISEAVISGGQKSELKTSLINTGKSGVAQKSVVPMAKFSESEKPTTIDKVAAVGLIAGAGYLLSIAATVFAGTAALTGLLPLTGVAIAGYFAYSLLKGRVHINS